MADLDLESIIKELSAPPTKAPLWQHILGAFMTGNPMAVTNLEQMQRNQKKEDIQLRLLLRKLKDEQSREGKMLGDYMTQPTSPQRGFYETQEGEQQTPFSFLQPSGPPQLDPYKIPISEAKNIPSWMIPKEPKAKEPYTLGRGQVRFGADDKPVALGLPEEDKLYETTDAEGNKIITTEGHVKRQLAEIEEQKQIIQSGGIIEKGVPPMPMEKRSGEVVQPPLQTFPFPHIKGGKKQIEREESTPNEIKQFEMETGTDKSLRGTKEYQNKINEWRKNKKEVVQFTSPFEQGKYAATLRKEFEDLRPVKDYRDTMSKFRIMQEAYKESQKTNNYIATDQAMITLFNKMTDPQSVVRESEYARTASDLALLNKLKGKVQRVVSGGPGLTPEDRKALLEMGSKFMKVYDNIYRDEVRRYRGYAEMAGLLPDTVASLPKDINYGDSNKIIIRTGIEKKTGKKVVEYSDGSIEYAK